MMTDLHGKPGKPGSFINTDGTGGAGGGGGDTSDGALWGAGAPEPEDNNEESDGALFGAAGSSGTAPRSLPANTHPTPFKHTPAHRPPAAPLSRPRPQNAPPAGGGITASQQYGRRPSLATNPISTNEAKTLFVVAVVLSLMVHVCVALGIYDTPLGSVDLSLLQPEDYKVIRADDLVVEDKPVERAPGLDPVKGDQPSLADLSQAMLLFDAANVKSTTPPPPVNPARNVAAAAAQNLVEPTLTQPDAAGIPNATFSKISGNAPQELAFVESTQTITKLGQGDTKSDPGDIDTGDPATAAAQALNLIGDADPTSNGTGGSGIGFDIAIPDTTFDPTDKTLARGSVSTPKIDVARINIGASRPKLSVPERLDEDFDYKLATYRYRTEQGYFRVDISAKRSLRKLRTLPKDVVFLVDTSGSIQQSYVKEMISGVTDALASLNPGDRFNIVLFKDTPLFLSPDKIMPVSARNIAAAQKFMTEAKSSGYTDVNQALTRLLTRDVQIERVYDMVLISDGVPTKGVMDTRELINLITRDNDLIASIYCVGVGRRQNRELLNFLAYRNKGFSVFCESSKTTRSEIRNLMSRLRYPIIKDINLDAVGIDKTQVFPRDLPNIHQGETISVYGRYARPGQFTMRMTGHNGEKRLDFTFTKQIPVQHDGDEKIAMNWAFWKLHHLYSELIRTGETGQIKAQIDYLRKKYGLKTLY